MPAVAAQLELLLMRITHNSKAFTLLLLPPALVTAKAEEL